MLEGDAAAALGSSDAVFGRWRAKLMGWGARGTRHGRKELHGTLGAARIALVLSARVRGQRRRVLRAPGTCGPGTGGKPSAGDGPPLEDESEARTFSRVRTSEFN